MSSPTGGLGAHLPFLTMASRGVSPFTFSHKRQSPLPGPVPCPAIAVASLPIPAIAAFLGNDSCFHHCVFHKCCKGQMLEAPRTTAHPPPALEYLSSFLCLPKGRTWVSRTHVICVDTFIDLPKKAFTKNTIQDHIFPGDAILWACTGDKADSPGAQKLVGTPRESKNLHPWGC